MLDFCLFPRGEMREENEAGGASVENWEEEKLKRWIGGKEERITRSQREDDRKGGTSHGVSAE